MIIKNIMEDIVSIAVDEVLAKESIKPSETSIRREDIIAYVLNKIPSKYITGERGILHHWMDSDKLIQQKSDILFLTYDAIKELGRRRPSAKVDYEEMKKSGHFFPHLHGKVLEESSLLIIPDIEVKLYYENSPAKMIDSNWKNPYITMKSTGGYYHFWPEFTKGMNPKGFVSFRISFTHPKFISTEIVLSMNVLDSGRAYGAYQGERGSGYINNV
jgi:hypothetical protein